MSAMDREIIMSGECNAVRHALAVERARGRHFRDELMAMADGKARWRWRRRLQSSIDRAAKLALALVDMGQAVPIEDVSTEFDGDLLDAMDMVRRKSSTRSLARIPCSNRWQARPARAMRRRV